jgi:hypothetical protein
MAQADGTTGYGALDSSASREAPSRLQQRVEWIDRPGDLHDVDTRAVGVTVATDPMTQIYAARSRSHSSSISRVGEANVPSDA